METTKIISEYYKRIIDQLLDVYNQEFENAGPGHCMKITGLGLNEIEYLWDIVSNRYPLIETFIVSENNREEKKYISATKLIEYRNKNDYPLLVLIPSNSRTAAEDSYGNATFKEISLEGIEEDLKVKLIEQIPHEYKKIIKEDLIKYLPETKRPTISIVSFLIDLFNNEFNDKNIGKYIFHFGLIPDLGLLSDKEKVRFRLKHNLESVELLSSFNKPFYERIAELPLAPNSIQKDIVAFLRTETWAKNANDICKLIYDKYPTLNFLNWPIPDLDTKNIKLFLEDIRSTDFTSTEGDKILSGKNQRLSKVKIRFSTTPNPREVSELKYFRIVLMAVDGGSGEEITTLNKIKNSESVRTYREATIELGAELIEEGSYFFKVLAEDENGNILNTNDDFKDPKINKAWQEALEENSDFSKSSFNYKLTCDSEDFDFIIDDQIEREDTQRKSKLSSVLQAFFRFRIEQLKKNDELTIPEPSEKSNIWLNDQTKKSTSTFYINYSEKHNYQINLPSKLRNIENRILQYKENFGFLLVELKNNKSAISLSTNKFIASDLAEIVPQELKEKRIKVFKLIQESNPTQNGIFETADIFNFFEEIKDYIDSYSLWTSLLRRKASDPNLSDEESKSLQHLLSELQMLDVVKVITKLPDGNPVEAMILSPLHPLRLSWWLQLNSVFSDWERKTKGYPNYISSWHKNLEDFFDGDLFPENNPLVLVEPQSLKPFLYSGELTFGWGLYLNVLREEQIKGMTSVSRQLKHYFRQLFNVSRENYVESEISLKLVVRHLKNYLAQHPYTDKLIINIVNAGDAVVFADAFIELEKDFNYKRIKYEVRIFKGSEKIIEQGEALKNLINPDFNVTEEAEAFSQPSQNRLFPKLRFSINNLDEYLNNPARFVSHLSFIISPFPLRVELVKPVTDERNFFLNGLLSESTIKVLENKSEIRWNQYIKGNDLAIDFDGTGRVGVSLFENIQAFISGALAAKITDSIPSTQLILGERDKVLLSHLHDHSDWVITFDKNLGPQIYDQPSKDGDIPFLLDYVPGEELSGISSYLTTRPTSEILGLLGPHFEEFNLEAHKQENENKIKLLLEDLRSVSSSLVLQLNSSKNKAFEVIGSALSKRVLEKKGFLKNAFLIPIDLHQNLFENLPGLSKSRADNLLVSIETEKKEINITVIEIKCRKNINEAEKIELKIKMKEQIQNTIEALKIHFDPENSLTYDRLDREIKNKELKSLLGFYIERAYRYEFLSENAYYTYLDFIQRLDEGFSLKFKQLGLIYNLSSELKHQKEAIDSELTYFTFGAKVIDDILDPDSDLNTKRLEDAILDDQLASSIGINKHLKPFTHKFRDSWMLEEKKSGSDFAENEPVNKETQIEKDEQPASPIIDEVDNSYEKEIAWGSNKAGPDEVKYDHSEPEFDIIIGKNESSGQLGILGESLFSKKIAIDLSETNTISLFGIQGGGKSYTIGTMAEMVLKQFNNINSLPSPLAGVIFHYSESMDYEPEYTSMIFPNRENNELKKLRERYGAEPDNIEDIIILTPKDKVEERQSEFPDIPVFPIKFNSKELNVQDWLFLLGAVGNDSAYIKQVKAIMKEIRQNITLEGITKNVEESELLSNMQKALARQKLSFAKEYVDDTFFLKDTLKPGRLIIVDLRDEFIVKDEALGLFVIMLNIFSGVKVSSGSHFNKFIVFDEAHKYMDNKELTGNIVTAIREMRHKGVSIMIASQDPPSLPNEIIELSSIVLLHKFNSPTWLKHVQKSITQLSPLTPADMSALLPGEGFLWANKASEKIITTKPMKITTRPRVTQHGGRTVQATGNL